jgi:flagellar biosynthesis protein FliQ
MAVAILAAVVGLLVVGLVVAVWAAARSRRKFPLSFKPAPWSDVELDELHGRQ